MNFDDAGTKTGRSDCWFAVILFGGLLAFHGWGASVGWRNLNLPGGEFRQTQTAISTFFIQRDHDFSLDYPTPVLGKPWAIPFEFPLYQWTVVLVSDATGLDLTKTGRVVSLGCFYLTLPALGLLLGHLGLAWPKRLVALGFVLSCPLYIFYGRAFLIETMALMFAGWFLVGYLRAVERRSPGWLVIASVTGAGAGLVKVTTLLFILLPAFGWTVTKLWQKRPGAKEGGWQAMLAPAAWALGTVLLPCLLTVWWTNHAEAVRQLNPAADFLRAGNMRDYYFGAGQRFSGLIWRQHAVVLFREIAPAGVLIGAGLLALLFARRWLVWIGLLLACFLSVQVIFPILYAWHEYYYVANAVALMLAIGLAACGVLESRLPRSASWLLIAALHGGQVWNYGHVQYPQLNAPSNGGSPITQALRAATEPDDVLIIAGNDWSSITPYFSQRRALMIRNGGERDATLLGRAFAGLNGETVGALVLHGAQRNNRQILDWVVRDFGLDPRPVFTCLDATIYFHQRLRLAAIPLVKAVPDAQFLSLTAESVADEKALLQHEVELARLPPRYRLKFAGMQPMPFKYYTTYGGDRMVVEGRDWFFAHPDTRLWFNAPPGRRTITIEAMMSPGAYADQLPFADRSDGFEVAISAERADGTRHLVGSRHLNPRDNPSDRGRQTIEQGFDLAAGEVVVLEVLPGPKKDYARDWALLGRVEIR